MVMSAKQLLAKAAECETCGKEHKPHKNRFNPSLAPQWGDPGDGHPYRARIPLNILGKLRGLM